MSADIVSITMLPARHQELIIFMDDYGTTHHLYVNVSDAANRASLIDQHQKDMEAAQTAMEAYAKANGHDLSSTKLANLAAKQAQLKRL